MSTFPIHPTFSTRESQPVLTFLGAPERLMVAGNDTGGEFALFESTGTRGHSAPKHRHLHASETFVVLEGEMLVEVGDEQRTAGAGDVAVLPRGVPHTFVIVSATARYLTLHTPAGFDAFVRDAGDLSRSGGAPDRAALAALATTYGIEILGPGLSVPGGE
jgi:quercetin dioxygenase-like cupin family protein